MNKYYAISENQLKEWRKNLNKAREELTETSAPYEWITGVEFGLSFVKTNNHSIPLEKTGLYYSKGDLVKELGIDWTIDYALPHGWVKWMHDEMGADVVPHFVMSYKDGKEELLPITEIGEIIYKMYKRKIGEE